MANEIDLNKMSIEQVTALRRLCEQHLGTWFGFSVQAKERQTPEFKAATAWRLEGKVEPCCECGENYPTVDLHFGGHVFCEKCRKQA
jgi:hypothetical protein